MIGLTDLDIVLYRAGFSVEKRGKRDVGNGETEHFREVAPLSHAIQNLRTVIESLEAKFEKLEYYITGKGNFRHEVATVQKYKGNRSPFNKPVHLEDMKKYMIEKYGAVVVDGKEADDELGIQQTSRENTCIISTDKDLDQIPGKHYNWVRDLYYDMGERESLRVFYRQMLTGDSTDNIPGIEGVGPVNASLIVDPYTKERGMWQAVKEEWHKRYPSGYHGIAVDRVLEEIGQLLWIQRTGRIRWEAP
jgi:5'-3' exonuclease